MSQSENLQNGRVLINRVTLNSHFTSMPNMAAEDPNLSWAAKGLLWYLCSRPLDWKVYVSQLVKVYEGQKKGGGRDAVKSALAELKENGYMTYELSRNSKGQWEHTYTVYQVKISVFNEIQRVLSGDPTPKNNEIQKKIPATVNPPSANPSSEKASIITSNDQTRNDIQKNNIYKSSSSKENDDDDFLNSNSSSDISDSSDLKLTRTNGNHYTVDLSSIYLHFVKLPQYPTEVLKEAIQRVRKSDGCINNVIKYLESTCKSILKEKCSKKSLDKTENKPADKVKSEPEKLNEKSTINFGDYLASIGLKLKTKENKK